MVWWSGTVFMFVLVLMLMLMLVFMLKLTLVLKMVELLKRVLVLMLVLVEDLGVLVTLPMVTISAMEPLTQILLHLELGEDADFSRQLSCTNAADLTARSNTTATHPTRQPPPPPQCQSPTEPLNDSIQPSLSSRDHLRVLRAGATWVKHSKRVDQVAMDKKSTSKKAMYDITRIWLND
ncbi:hypothetical protein QR685DRAFT_540454 [Neurospora intermedia]|uniref:Uncharacterized protein n=1 Tax=Neurospora intermedia TaxID=5142 RepID=A0ABR3DR04_NEUIN